MEEMKAVADYINRRGRIAIGELAAKSNTFIDLEAKATTVSFSPAPSSNRTVLHSLTAYCCIPAGRQVCLLQCSDFLQHPKRLMCQHAPCVSQLQQIGSSPETHYLVTAHAHLYISKSVCKMWFIATCQ